MTLPEWALVVATFERPDVLQLALDAAVEQDPQPAEVIVVDASIDPEPALAAVAKLADAHPAVRVVHIVASTASLPAQRLQGVHASSAPVLMMFDDDAVMEPGCAAALLEIYAADTDGDVLGVEASAAPTDVVGGGRRGRDRFVQRVLMADPTTQFVPYDGQYPAHPIPPTVLATGAVRVRLMEGYRMTLRRQAFDLEQPEAMLPGAAYFEDYDFSYRVSRHGALVGAPGAHVVHLQAAGGRRSFEATIRRSLCNQAFTIRRYGTSRRARMEFVARAVWRGSTGVVRDRWAGRRLSATVRATAHGLQEALPIIWARGSNVEARYLTAINAERG